MRDKSIIILRKVLKMATKNVQAQNENENNEFVLVSSVTLEYSTTINPYILRTTLLYGMKYVKTTNTLVEYFRLKFKTSHIT